MNSKNVRTRRIQGRESGSSAMQVLEAHLNNQDEAAWYAERIERLGKVIFGDLWESDKSEAVRKQQEMP